MFRRIIDRYPVLLKCFSTACITSLGDFLTQTYIEKKEEIDWRRNNNFTILGFFYSGPFLYYWHLRFLPYSIGRYFGPNISRLKFAIVGVILGQVIFTPIFLPFYFIFQGILRERSLKGFESGMKLLKERVVQTVITNFQFWPAATMINLMFVPLKYRVLYSNFVGIMWNMYLSYVSYECE